MAESKARRDHRRSTLRAAMRGAVPMASSTGSDMPLQLSGQTAMVTPMPLPLPDLLWMRPHAQVDEDALSEILDLAFMGRDPGAELDRQLDGREVASSSWRPELFAADLYVEEMVASCLRVEHHGRSFPLRRRFVTRVLCQTPTDHATIEFRQGILRAMLSAPAVRRRVEQLHLELHQLHGLFRAARSDARLNHASFRVEILRQARQVIACMADGFRDTGCGLDRLAAVASEMKASPAHRLLDAVLDYEGSSGRMQVELAIGADGRARDVVLTGYAEDRRNRFHRPPWRRWLDLLTLFWHRASLDEQMIVDAVIYHAYLQLAPALRSLLQIQVHLEVYLANLGFRELAARHGLDTCLARLGYGGVDLEGLFNPLLLGTGGKVVAAELQAESGTTTLVTGPNSGGKTRLLQGVGLAQLLGQGGFFCPASRAALPLLHGLFASLVDRSEVDQAEGRLGTELVRIKELFSVVRPGSMVLIDELCSGTNPSEATEIVTMVLELLELLEPVALVSTHFLDFAAAMAERGVPENVRFLQVEIDSRRRPTYRFGPGVAQSSLAAATAERLGVTFGELAAAIRGVREAS